LAVSVKHATQTIQVGSGNPDLIAETAWNEDHDVTGLGTMAEATAADYYTSAEVDTEIAGLSTVYQPLDADLTTWAGLTPSANAQSLVTAANYAAMRGLLDLEAGTDFYSIAAADSAFIAEVAEDASPTLGGSLDAGGFDITNVNDLTVGNDVLCPNSGTILNFGAGDVTITYTSNALTVAGGNFFIVDEAYDSGAWNGNLSIPTKNAVRDYLETLTGTTLPAAYQPLDGDLTSWAGVTRASGFDTFAATPSSANLDALVTDDTGSGVLVFNDTPTLIAPLLGTPTSGTLTNCTGLTSGGVAAATLVTAADTVASNDNDTTWPTTAAIIDYAQPLDSDLTAVAALTTTAAGRSVLTIADAGVDRMVAWDDSAGAMAAIALADLTDEAAPAAGDYILLYGAEGDLRKTNWNELPGVGGGISNVVEDTTPQLGGALDCNGFGIELGTGATDTTLTRSDAGVAAIEGSRVHTDNMAGIARGYIWGLTMSRPSTSTVTVAAGSARSEADTDFMVLAAPITKSMAGTFTVGDNQNGLNTGAEANSTWYEVHLIKRSDTGVVDVMITTTGNRATLPANYDRQRRIGWIRNDGSGNLLDFTQVDDHFTWLTQVNDVAATCTETAAQVALTVPPSTMAYFRGTAASTASVNENASLVFSEISEGNVTPATTTGIGSLAVWDLVAYNMGHFQLKVNSSSQIEHDSDNAVATFDISTFAWDDNRRRLSDT
jgi:hypothetical protein